MKLNNIQELQGPDEEEKERRRKLIAEDERRLERLDAESDS